MSKALTGNPAAQARANNEEHDLSLLAVHYDAQTDVLDLMLSSDIRLSIPRRYIYSLDSARPDELARLYPGNGGASISQDDLDLDICVPGMLDRLFGRSIRAAMGYRFVKASQLPKT